MMGNDLVDLQLAKTQSNWQRPKFLKKIFTKVEQAFISNSKNPELQVWRFWTMKEAAYKAYNRETGIRGFFPWKLHCEMEDFRNVKFAGKVSIDDRIYFTETIENEEFVYTIAASSLQYLDNIIEINSDTIILKIEDLPFTSISRKPVSITHHGKFERKITFSNNFYSDI